jgi:methionyl-tRNA formyltransferase
MIEKEQGRIDWAKPAVELERRLRAFTPWPGAFTSYRGAGFKVHRAKVAEGKGAPGEILRASPESIEVACGQGSLVLLEVQPEGKRRMTAAEFLAGNKLERGARPFGAAQAGA